LDCFRSKHMRMQRSRNVHLISNELNPQLISYLQFITTNHLDHNGTNVRNSHFYFPQSRMIQIRLYYRIQPKNSKIVMNFEQKKIKNFLNAHPNFLVL